MTPSPFMNDDISVKRINGKLCLVRPSRRKARISSSYELGRVLSIGYDLLSEVFDGVAFGMDKDKAEAEAEKSSVLNHGQDQNPMAPAMQAPPQPGVYQQGNRQLVLLPKVPTGHGPPPLMHQGHFGYPQQPLMYGGHPQMMPMMANMGFGGFNSQYDKLAAPVATPTSITVTRHLCANCGNLRSKKYQAAHPLQADDTAPVSFCRKCEKEFRSTDSQVEIELPTKKSRMHYRKVQREKNVKKVVYEKDMFPAIHVCGQCGNSRSRKYQATHPINAGDVPPVSYCGKCQKEVTSSEDSDPSEGETVIYLTNGRNTHEADRNYYRDRRIKLEPNTLKNTLKNTDQRHYLHLDGESGSTASKVTPAKPSFYRLLRELIFGQKVHEGEYTVVSEKSSDRGRRNQRRFKGDGDDLPQSPLVAIREPIRRRSSELLPAAVRRTRSSSRRRTRRGKAQPPSEHYEYDSRESSDVEGLAEIAYRDYLSDGAPLHERERSPERPRYRSPKSQAYRRRVSAQVLEDYLSEDSLAKFREAASSRRRERASLPPQNVRSPHPGIQEELKTLKDDEMLVVTERYVYRPQKSTPVIGELRDERAGRGRQPHRAPQKLISENDAAEYYPEEWSRTKSRTGRKTYQRIRPRDLDGAGMPSGPGSSQASIDQQSYEGTDIRSLLPPAPTPPSVSTATSGSVDTYSYSSRDTAEYPPAHKPRSYRSSRLPGEYQPSSESGSSMRAASPRVASPQVSRPQRSPTRTRRGSRRYRSPYVRDANSGGSEGAWASSRSRSRERVVFYSENEEEPSDLTANDRIDKRRVAFGPDEVRMISRESLAAERRRNGRFGREREQEREFGVSGMRYGN
ncbi:hypothetical protein V493_05631 [Pseudogymnoascus sp. VKM F-4281 (FW-2241)]|nr:hypothetical protein V493_05631 [Pseudogymnoascus sp. VKM F-4281 (FW-2241)]